jgi:hypothetical protein
MLARVSHSVDLVQSTSQPIASVEQMARSTSAVGQEAWDEPLQGLPVIANVDGKDMTFGPYLSARRAAEAYCSSWNNYNIFPLYFCL